ncbi:prolyl oligopeptidase family serine peptidase [Brevundimonas sp.]|uniref:prolyl oligopeptidase family serine peptidase n=1 Tax=Brevundimonas sp. TaxID=1871086 RepID=UPI003D6D99C1
MIDAGFTRPDRLAAFGYSNGGLLVGGAVARRPDLYAVAMPTVGVLDMLRFPQSTNGRLWIGEYGDPQDPARPVLLTIDKDSGHGAGNSRSKTAKSAADRLAFAARHLDLTVPVRFDARRSSVG